MTVARAYGVGTFARMVEQDPQLQRLVNTTRPFVAKAQKQDWAQLEGNQQAPSAKLGFLVTQTVRPLVEESARLTELLLDQETWHHTIAASRCAEAAAGVLAVVDKHAGKSNATNEDRQTCVLSLIELLAKAAQALQVGEAMLAGPEMASAREASARASAEAQAYAENARVATEQLSMLSEKARAAANETEIIRGASDFAKAEERHAQLARRWLAAAGVSAGLLVGAAVLGIMVEGPKLGELSWLAAVSLAYFAPRALLVSAISYALAVCVRNYRSERHNEATNGHRARALRTFETLRLAAKDGRAQDLLLAQAMGAIFSSQPTGYASGGGDGTHVAELVAALAPKKEE